MAMRFVRLQLLNSIYYNPAQLGNPNLKPESIETWELAGDYRATRDLHLALNFFTYFYFYLKNYR